MTSVVAPSSSKPGFERCADEGAGRVAGDEDLAIGRGARGEAAGGRRPTWASGRPSARQAATSAAMFVVGRRRVARDRARIDRLLRLDNDEHGVRGQSHGAQIRRGASAQ